MRNVKNSRSMIVMSSGEALMMAMMGRVLLASLIVASLIAGLAFMAPA